MHVLKFVTNFLTIDQLCGHKAFLLQVQETCTMEFPAKVLISFMCWNISNIAKFGVTKLVKIECKIKNIDQNFFSFIKMHKNLNIQKYQFCHYS